MSGLNRVTLLGNLGADPELRFTASGTPVLNMRMATTETYIDKNKEKQQKTDWHRVVVWGAQATALAKLLSKGACILVEGGLRNSSYEKDGVTHYKTEVHAKEVCFTGRKPLSETGEDHVTAVPAVQAAPVRAMKKPNAQPPLAFEVADQIPF